MISSFFDIEKHPASKADDQRKSFFDHAWRGFTLRQYYSESGTGGEQISSSHLLQFNFGNPISLSWKTNGVWMTGVCNTGNLVELLPKGEKEELVWDPAYYVLELAFDQSFIDTLMEFENFRLRKQHNLCDPFLSGLVKELREASYSGAAEKLYVESLGVACAIHIATTHSESDKKIFAPKGKLSSHQLRNIIDFVRSSIHDVITLEELASSIHLSVFHFSRLFKNTVGVSPYQFVLRMKIEFAKNLIKRKQPIGDIAYSLGFTDSAHFCNAFKKLTGLSPLQSYLGSRPATQLIGFPFENNNDALKLQ
jgi:AraC family transcriptional regulator